MSADATEALWDALTSKNTQSLVEQMRAAPVVPAVDAIPRRIAVVIVKNELDSCHVCDAPAIGTNFHGAHEVGVCFEHDEDGARY